jgi:pheromone shutdown protein TraB
LAYSGFQAAQEVSNQTVTVELDRNRIKRILEQANEILHESNDTQASDAMVSG